MKKYIIILLGCIAAYAVFVLGMPAEPSAFQTTAAKSGTSSGNKNIEKINAIRAIVFAWARTWGNKDVNKYMSYYSPKFQSGDVDYQLWREKKSKVFQRRGAISVEINDLWVFVEGNFATASFIQKYRDAKYSDMGEKVLKLIHVSDTWKIVSESWKPLKR